MKFKHSYVPSSASRRPVGDVNRASYTVQGFGFWSCCPDAGCGLKKLLGQQAVGMVVVVVVVSRSCNRRASTGRRPPRPRGRRRPGGAGGSRRRHSQY